MRIFEELGYIGCWQFEDYYKLDKEGFVPMTIMINNKRKEFSINSKIQKFNTYDDIKKAILSYSKSTDKTLKEKLGSNYEPFIAYCEELIDRPLLPTDIFNFPNTEPTYEELKKSLQEHKDILWKEHGKCLMYEDKYYQRTAYQPRIKSEEEILKDQLFCEKLKTDKEVQDGLGNYFHQSDIDNSKVEIYDAKSYFKSWTGFFPKLTDKAEMKYWNGKEMITIKYITSDIQHVITPSKNYFLFKLS